MIKKFPRPHDKILYVILKEVCTATPFRINFKHFSFYINSQITQHLTKMIDYIKEPHTSIFIGQTGCGKTHLVLELIEKEYKKHFDYIIIICPTLRENNSIYHAKEWFKKMIRFDLYILKRISINGLKSCQNYYNSSGYYL